MLDARKHFRLKRRISANWRIASQGKTGRGQISNISVAGVCFQTETLFQPRTGTTFLMDAPGIPEFPRRATLRWFRRVNRPGVGYICGVVFVKEGAFYPPVWRQWMERHAEDLSED